MHHHAQLMFVILVEIGFPHVDQAGLELLTSGDPPASASQSAGTTGMSHHTRLTSHFIIQALQPRVSTAFMPSVPLLECQAYGSYLHPTAQSLRQGLIAKIQRIATSGINGFKL